MWRPVVETRDVNSSSISSGVFGETIGVCFKLMRFEIHLGVEYHKFLVHALLICTQKVILAKMLL